MTRLSLLLLIIFLEACGSQAPSPPAFDQCGYSVRFNKFRCCNSVTKQCVNLKREDPVMEAAQCVSADDFKALSGWVDALRAYGQTHCH